MGFKTPLPALSRENSDLLVWRGVLGGGCKIVKNEKKWWKLYEKWSFWGVGKNGQPEIRHFFVSFPNCFLIISNMPRNFLISTTLWSIFTHTCMLRGGKEARLALKVEVWHGVWIWNKQAYCRRKYKEFQCFERCSWWKQKINDFNRILTEQPYFSVC